MLKAFSLLLPALIPSWNFFDVIAPSPRIEYALLSSPSTRSADWRAFRPRPQRLSLLAMLGRLFWNARWNETLFLVSCAERLTTEPTAHSEDEIFRRIAADLAPRGSDEGPSESWLCFRLIFLSRRDETIESEVLFQPAPRRLVDIAVQ